MERPVFFVRPRKALPLLSAARRLEPHEGASLRHAADDAAGVPWLGASHTLLMKRTSLLAIGSLLLGFACTEVAPAPPGEVAGTVSTASSQPGAAPVAERVAPPWEGAPESPAPPGFGWRSVHHETIHARLLVPDGAKVESTRDGYGYPRVDIDVGGNAVLLQFDSGIGKLGNTLAGKPPTVYGLPVEKVHFGPENVAARYRTKPGDLRISGFAPGVKCIFEPFGAVPAAALDKIFTVCASLRSPAPGAWRRATVEERAHGGMTDVPAGGWVEGALPPTPGSLLRPGKHIARLHLGALVLSGAQCPPSIEPLREREVDEAEVVVEERKTAGGDAWLRRATDVHDGDRFPGDTTLFARRGGGCCRAMFVPWTAPPSAAQVDYALALCDTFRAE